VTNDETPKRPVACLEVTWEPAEHPHDVILTRYNSLADTPEAKAEMEAFRDTDAKHHRRRVVSSEWKKLALALLVIALAACPTLAQSPPPTVYDAVNAWAAADVVQATVPQPKSEALVGQASTHAFKAEVTAAYNAKINSLPPNLRQQATMYFDFANATNTAADFDLSTGAACEVQAQVSETAGEGYLNGGNYAGACTSFNEATYSWGQAKNRYVAGKQRHWDAYIAYGNCLYLLNQVP
jgi:hypothetical protein